MGNAVLSLANVPLKAVHDFATGAYQYDFELIQSSPATGSGSYKNSLNAVGATSPNPVSSNFGKEKWFSIFLINNLAQEGASAPNPTFEQLPALTWLNDFMEGTRAYRKHKQFSLPTRIEGLYGNTYKYRIRGIGTAVGTDFEDKTLALNIQYFHEVLSLNSSQNYGSVSRTMEVYQKSVALFKVNNSVDYPLNTLNTTANTTILFDKTLSRGAAQQSTWSILKRVNIPFSTEPAVLGVDYNIISGTIGDLIDTNILEIEFLTAAEFRVSLNTTGNGDGLGLPTIFNKSSKTFTVSIVEVPIINTVVLPVLTPLLAPTTNPLNNVIEFSVQEITVTSPFEIQCSPVLDTTNAIWTQEIEEVITVVSEGFTTNQWLDALIEFSKIICIVRNADNNTIIEQRDCDLLSGFTHVFSLLQGAYRIGYKIEPL